MARRMAEAARQDSEARARNEPALHKLALLPDVTAMLNRGGAISESIVDPENDLLRSITFFLEPSHPDGALPAYAIQKELFAVLPRLPITSEELRGDSRLGQVVLFYTKSKKPEPAIKRQAERLLTKWMSVMLKRPNDYRNRDPAAMQAYAFPYNLSKSKRTNHDSAVALSPCAQVARQPKRLLVNAHFKIRHMPIVHASRVVSPRIPWRRRTRHFLGLAVAVAR